MKLRRMNKKGDFQSYMYIIVAFFIIALFFLFFHKIYTPINEEFAGHFDDQNTSREVLAEAQSTVDGADYMFIFLLIGMIIVVALLAAAVYVHPVFAFPAIIVIAVMVIVGGALSEMYDKFQADEDFVNETDTYNIIGWSMDNYIIIIVIMGLVLILALFAKGYIGGGYGG